MATAIDQDEARQAEPDANRRQDHADHCQTLHGNLPRCAQEFSPLWKKE